MRRFNSLTRSIMEFTSLSCSSLNNIEHFLILMCMCTSDRACIFSKSAVSLQKINNYYYDYQLIIRFFIPKKIPKIFRAFFIDLYYFALV